ncbi:MAG: ABC transporter permease [Lachnospiraceae bacterium]|nr:ABC transporter permease [Lachnospiraceae bacterium]
MRFYKIKALIKLGLEDLTKNMSVFVYVLLPIVFALLYSNIDTLPKSFTFSICMLMNIAMLPVSLMGTIVAEEKEKHTLRTLMLNDVKASEILFAKASICVLFVIIDDLIIFFFTGLPMEQFAIYQLIGLFVAVAVILFGAFVGLFAKNQMSAGLLSMPFMVLFLAPMFTMMVDNKVFSTITDYIPTAAMMNLFDCVALGSFDFSSVIKPFAVIAAWLVISIIMFNIAYKKVGVDN